MEFVLGKIRGIWGFFKHSWMGVLLILLLLPAVWDLLKPGFFPMHDDLQVFRLFELDKCVHDLQIPCRWVPDAGFGYGYPLMQFYPPMPYYPMEILKLLGLGYFWPVKIMFAMAFIVSGWGMYLLAKTLYGKWGGVLSAMLYVYAPYHSVDIYVRGAMNEAWGMAWFPFVLLYIYKSIHEEKIKKNLLFLGLFLGLQLTSHNVMTMVFAPSAVLWALFWLWQTKKYTKIKDLFLSGIFGVGLAAFFFLPVVLEQKFVHVDSMIVGYFNYMAHFVDINQLFFSSFWGYGGSTWGPEDGMSFAIGHLQWIAAAIAGIFSLQYLKKDTKKFLMILMFIILGLGYAFLTHSRSISIWGHLSLLQYSQFPWRLVALIVFYFSLAGGFLATLKLPRNFGRVIFIVALFDIVIWNMPFFRVERHQKITLAEKLSGRQWELQVTGGIFDYLPRSAPKPPGDPAFTQPIYLFGQGGVLNYRSGSNWQTFDADVSSPVAKIMLPFYTYPGLVVKVNNQKVNTDIDPDLGRVIVNLPTGQSHVYAKIGYTPIRLISDLVSLITFIIFLKLWQQWNTKK